MLSILIAAAIVTVILTMALGTAIAVHAHRRRAVEAKPALPEFVLLRDELNGWMVSTVRLPEGINPPYESMVFAPSAPWLERDSRRYYDETEAMIGHGELVALHLRERR